MPKSGLNVALKGLDDLFSSEETRQEEQREQVQQIPVDELFPFKNHPFKVLDDDAMTRTVESISQFGVLAPLIARPRPEGGYEIISGHRRKHAAELAHLDTVPVIVRNMEDDAATILMVDSNLQREHILPSERAFAYKMKLDAIKNQGARSDLTSSQVGTKLRADEKVAKDSGESRNQVQRFVRLTNLVPELLAMVDEKKISFNPAVELSYLDEKQQQDFLEAMDAYDEKKTAGERLILACMELPNAEEQVVGSYRGFELSLRFDTFHNEHQALLKGTLKYPVPLGSDPHGNIVRLDNALSNFADRSTAAENELDTLRQQQAAAQVEVAKPFPQEEELAQKSARLAELNAQLDVDEKHHEPEQDEEEKEDAPRRSVLAVLEEKAEKAEPVKPFKSYLDKDGDAR